MAERKLKSLLKAPILSWSANALVVASLCVLWRLTDSLVWLIVLIIYALFGAFRNTSSLRPYTWMYVSFWVVVLSALSGASETGIVLTASIFFGFLFFMLTGVVQVQFREPSRQLSLFYFLLVFSVAALFALQGPGQHTIGTILLVILFLYVTGKEYMLARTATHTKRTRVYLLALALITAEALWILSLLSIGFLNVASLILVLYMQGMTIVADYFNGALRSGTLFKDALFFAIFSAAILIISGLL